MDGVTILDAGGLAALNKFLDNSAKTQTQVYLADFQYQPLKTLAKARFKPDNNLCTVYSTLFDALADLPDKKGL